MMLAGMIPSIFHSHMSGSQWVYQMESQQTRIVRWPSLSWMTQWKVRGALAGSRHKRILPAGGLLTVCNKTCTGLLVTTLLNIKEQKPKTTDLIYSLSKSFVQINSCSFIWSVHFFCQSLYGTLSFFLSFWRKKKPSFPCRKVKIFHKIHLKINLFMIILVHVTIAQFSWGD